MLASPCSGIGLLCFASVWFISLDLFPRVASFLKTCNVVRVRGKGGQYQVKSHKTFSFVDYHSDRTLTTLNADAQYTSSINPANQLRISSECEEMPSASSGSSLVSVQSPWFNV